MHNLVVAATFQNVGEPDNIAVDIREGLLDRVAHSCLCGQIDNYIELSALKNSGYPLAVLKVQFNEFKLLIYSTVDRLSVINFIDIDT